ncbi:MAG: GIN domain-containing protein [Archangium sp.]
MTRLLLAALVPVVMLTGCWNQVDGGPSASDTRSQDAFSRVRLESGLTASFKPGSPSVTINSQEKVIENIDTIVRDGRLYVRIKPGVKVSSLEWTEIIITGTDVTQLEANGGATLNATGLTGATIDFDVSGGSEVSATGNVTAVDIEVSGGSTAKIHANSETAKVEVSGGSNVEVTATGTVRGEASGGSKVRVAGGGDLAGVESSGGSVVSVLEQ